MSTTTTIKLRDNVIVTIRANQKLKNKLQLGLDMSSSTLYRLLAKNDEKLTTAAALRIISEELNIPKDDLLTE